MSKLDIAALTSHPIQYQAPLFREITDRPDVDLTVYFCDTQGLGEKVDPGFGTSVEWDVPLLTGYESEFLRNPTPDVLSGSPLDPANPGVVSRLLSRNHDVAWVHGYAGLTNWFAFGAAAATDTPVVLRGESTLLNPPAEPLHTVKRTVLSKLFDTVDAFATIGSRNREFYRSYGVDESRLFDAPYTVDNDFFTERAASLPPKSELRSELDLPTDRPIALFVGKLVERKRPRLLLDAFCQATDPGEATLLYVGDGSRRQAVAQHAVRLGREDDVVFAGFQNQSKLPEFYAAADVFVLPSVRETWGLVVNEAMNFGLPIVTTDAVGASVDLVEHDVNGLVVPPDDEAQLAAALGDLLSDAAAREAMGEQSREKISSWSITETADGIVDAARWCLREETDDAE